ncbi:MAG: exodeoxyribonuclease VII large subunit [Proteobacteria bacterium]|nr:exodeoxyribonuclease VII large subunit [Pseudomonadota bacterium]
MSPSDKASPKYYMYQQEHERWVIAMSNDMGIILNMQDAGAEVIELKKGGVARPYWALPKDGFKNVRRLLDNVGYTEFIIKSGPQTADYRVQSISPAKQTPAPQPQIAATPQMFDSLEKTYSIPEICELISKRIRNAFPEYFWIKGEISGLKPSKPGNKALYFQLVQSANETIKDKLILDAKIWFNNWYPIKAKFDLKNLKIEDGTLIRAYGKIEYYAGKSDISFNILNIDENLAEGEFFKKKYEIEQKLTAMGIHDTNKLLPMPTLPLRLAVFSNRGAEGWNDFITCLRNSDYPFKITLFTVNVQGKDLESSFLREFTNLQQIGIQNFDLGIIVRGGGSMTDLDWFNNLKIAEYIARSPLKFVVGIGHENDRNVLDEIASREKTPTAVAEMLIRKLDEHCNFLTNTKEFIRTQTALKMQAFQSDLNALASACANAIQKKRANEEKQLEQLKADLRFNAQDRLNQAHNDHQMIIAQIRDNVRQTLHSHQRVLDSLATQLAQNSEKITDERQYTLNTLIAQLQNVSQTRIDKELLALQHASSLISERVQTQKNRAETELQTLTEKIELLNPAKLFERGFAAISKDGAPLTSVEEITHGDSVSIRLLDGKLGATVNTITKLHNPG